MMLITPGRVLMSAGAAAAGGLQPNFIPLLYTGNASTQSITGAGFQPDLVWIKNRDAAWNHHSFDVRRGVTKELKPDTTDLEAANADTVTSFDADGFSIGDDAAINSNGAGHVAWCWKAEETAAHASHDGENYNTATGLSIIEYQGTGLVKTINHSLGVKPGMIIIKNRDSNGNWAVQHVGVAADYETDVLFLNTNSNASDSSSYWDDTEPTTTQFTLGTNGGVNTDNDNYVAYLFASVEGFSKFGNYTGNGNATGPTITTGFKPGYVLIKVTNGAGVKDWAIFDSARDASNPRTEYLLANDTDTEASGADVDFNATSFQIKSDATLVNENTKNYIYACFADTWT